MNRAYISFQSARHTTISFRQSGIPIGLQSPDRGGGGRSFVTAAKSGETKIHPREGKGGGRETPREAPDMMARIRGRRLWQGGGAGGFSRLASRQLEDVADEVEAHVVES